jgi:hypothetical protein
MLLTDKDEDTDEAYHLDLYEIRVERLWRGYLGSKGRYHTAEEASGIIVAVCGDKWRGLMLFINAADLKTEIYAMVFAAFAVAALLAFWAGMKA